MLVTMKCPSCAADLQIDDSRDFMFCQYCGTKIANLAERVQVSGSVKLDNSTQVQNIFQRAYEFEKAGRIDDAVNYYNRVLDLDLNYAPAREGLARCNTVITHPNVTITFKTIYHDFILQTSINNKQITKYRNGDAYSFTLPVGTHKVKFRIGSHRYSRAVVITDRNTRINILYINDGRNHIDIS